MVESESFNHNTENYTVNEHNSLAILHLAFC